MTAYRLQKVLDHRRRLEDEQQAATAAAMSERVRAEAALVALRDTQRRLGEELQRMLREGSLVFGMAEMGRAVLAHTERVDTGRTELDRLVAAEQEQQSRLIAATVARKALDRARERFMGREEQERRRQETREHEELSITRAAERRGAAGNGAEPW